MPEPLQQLEVAEQNQKEIWEETMWFALIISLLSATSPVTKDYWNQLNHRNDPHVGRYKLSDIKN